MTSDETLTPSGKKGLGRRIGELRRRKGWSQRDLATRVGTTAGLVGKYERGIYEPRASLVRRIAEELGATTDFLITGHEPGTVPDARLRRLLPVLEHLPGELRLLVAEFLECVVQTSQALRPARKPSD